MNALSVLRGLPRYLLGVALVFGADVLLGAEISFWVPMLFPIGLATWNRSKRLGLIVAVVAIVALLVEALAIGSPFRALPYLLFALSSKATVFFAFVVLLDKLRQQEVGRLFVQPSDPQP